MTKISENILKTIEAQHVKPEPKWKFLAKDGFVWVAFVALLLVVALAFAVILDFVANYDWDIYTYLHKTFLQYVLLSLPYVWIALLALFFAVAYYDFIHIRGWYRHRVYLVVLASIFLSFGCGLIFFFAGFGKTIDRALTKNVPFYEKVKINKEQLWNHPDQGLLEGEIVEVKNENEFVLEDPSGKQWEVQDASIQMNKDVINQGENVEIIGGEKDSNDFVAKSIREADNEREDEFIKKKEATRAKKNNKAQEIEIEVQSELSQ